MGKTSNPENIFYIVSSIRKAAYAIIEGELNSNGIRGLMYTHGAILFALYKNGGSMKLSDLAVLINRKKPTVTVLVDKLSAHDYVRRIKSDTDSRIVMVSITEKGMRISGTFKTIEKLLRKKALAGFSNEEIIQLMSLLDRIRLNITEK